MSNLIVKKRANKKQISYSAFREKVHRTLFRNLALSIYYKAFLIVSSTEYSLSTSLNTEIISDLNLKLIKSSLFHYMKFPLQFIRYRCVPIWIFTFDIKYY